MPEIQPLSLVFPTMSLNKAVSGTDNQRALLNQQSEARKRRRRLYKYVFRQSSQPILRPATKTKHVHHLQEVILLIVCYHRLI